MRSIASKSVFIVLLVAAVASAVPAAGAVDAELLAGMGARAIGPATMSGRVAAIAVTPGNVDQVWVGAATGGLWRSDDGGLTWTPLFDDQPVAAIGAVALSPANPSRVWVGTGEGNPRNSASVGNGVYRSDDGGETWTHLGLEESERVHRIVLHPTDPDVAWVCALGPSWGDGGDRGVYKTSDGGGTWRQVLAANPTTGCADLEADPVNPSKLIAALWDHRRWPWFFRSGGPGSGIHVSHDGGETWSAVTTEDGLPEGELGRVGLAIAPSEPKVVYAFVEAETNGVYRSGDGGRTWELTSSEEEAGNRPFYYADLRVDPEAPGRVYSLWSLVSVSDDGGKTFEVLVPFNKAHPDHHAMWIDPDDPEHVWLGNDGGVYESRDRGESWRFVRNLPLAQLYHVRVDELQPYHVYFGLQDNGSWRGPAEVWENGGIRNHHWQEVWFGDGFDTAPIPGDESRGYAMSQEGYLARWDVETGEQRSLRPAPPEGGPELRFNWNAALAVDPFDADTVYFGSQFVHRSRDRGETWETISPDLTSDDPEHQRQAESGGLTLDVTGAENFTTLVALAPSPVEPGVLWAGSDDGRLHLTRDGGETWERLDGNLRGVPDGTWIPHVEASPHDAATAFVVLDDHRRSNWTPYVYATTDFGRTWRRLVDAEDATGEDGVRGYALSIVQDPVDPDLLFLGTEFGLWTSLDRGDSWLRFGHGVPTVSVMDLAIQRREGDLVIGTHGRGVYVIDDLTPLRDLDPAALEAPLHLFPVGDAVQYEVAQSGSTRFPGQGEFRGENEPYGALIRFAAAGDDLPHPDEETERQRKIDQRERRREARESGETGEVEAAEGGEEAAGEDAKEGDEEGDEGPKAEIEVRDADGEVVRTFETPVHRGVNTAAWDLRHDAFDRPKTDEEPSWWEEGGPEVVPGAYTVTVRFRDAEASAPVTVLPDPRQDVAPQDRRAKSDALLRLGALQNALAAAIDRVRQAGEDVATALERHAEAREDEEDGDGDGGEDPFTEAGRELASALDELEKELWTPPDFQGIRAETTPWDHVSRAGWVTGGDRNAPTAAQRRYLEIAETATAEAIETVNRFFAEEVAPFRQRVREAEIELLPEEEPLEAP